ncbi:unnamed protein product [Onchocerca flexuosa]|uniref:Uncharacterized protein n=1 Tax=Onchocerca flexuosa TaxID=387005 RepID=A0A183HGS0_9BILA|nr:unnamed protein product [Onchocerca flexuosa]
MLVVHRRQIFLTNGGQLQNTPTHSSQMNAKNKTRYLRCARRKQVRGSIVG